MAPESSAVAKRPIGDQIETLMGEFRIVLPALAVLFGFQLTVVFQAGFRDAGLAMRALNFAALVTTGLAILFLLTPISYHRFTQGLDESYGYLHMAQRNAGAAFVFLALSLCITLGVQATESFGFGALAPAVAVGFAVLLALAWWVMPAWRAHHRGTYAVRWLPHDDPDVEKSPGSERSTMRRRDDA